MKITDYLKNNTLYLDGAMGTMLQSLGLAPGELPEEWNLSQPDKVISVHKSYFDAGCNVVSANTFGANILKFSPDKLEEIIKSAVENVKTARDMSLSPAEKWIALDVGPTGRMLAPYGDLSFEDAVGIFAETVKLGTKYGVDLIFIQTMNDSLETKAALLAAKENCDLPVFVANAYGEDGKLMTGASPHAMIAMLEGMGADAIGMNCSLGPDALAPVISDYIKYASVPIILKPNAGLPKVLNGKTVYDVSEADFAQSMAEFVKGGIRAVGGCCGTTPKYISALVKKCKAIPPKNITKRDYTAVSSYTHAVTLGQAPCLIGERINPTGKKRFKEALKNHDIDYILKEGIMQQDKGVHILDVNVGLPEIDEVKMLKEAVLELQAVVDLPLQIDTSDPIAMEAALRCYNGKAMINSVNGKAESMEAVFPLAAKYGGVIVALTLDENGIPPAAEGRLEIAKKILSEAEKWGIDKKDIIFDPLALTVSADHNAAGETLKAVKMIKNELKCHVSLGVSNVSFGLPSRETITSAFFTLALSNGLSAAIMNPYSDEMMKAYYSYRTLMGLDENCSDYIAFASSLGDDIKKAATPAMIDSLEKAIEKGLSEQAALFTRDLIKTNGPLKIVTEKIIPALDRVGIGFENKTIYLPQLLMSAEAAKSAFEVIKSNMPPSSSSKKNTVVIATVKGDIHDIGKNIVKLLLENYGFDVLDLGRDVEPEKIVEAVCSVHSPIVGLSALMTTTVPAMEETIGLLKASAPWCKIVVGGAVLTREYADMIGADKYAKDAMETVRYAEEICKI